MTHLPSRRSPGAGTMPTVSVQFMSESRKAAAPVAAVADMAELFERLPEAVVIVSPDRRILQINPAFTQVFGYTVGEAIGRTLDDLIVPESSRGESREIMRSALAGEPASAETVRRRRDGTTAEVSVLGAPIQLRDGSQGVFGIYRDITDRKRAEARLRLLAVAMEAVDESVSIVEADGRVVYTNPAHARILGYPPAAGTPRHIRDFMPDPAARAEIERNHEQVRREGRWSGRTTRRTLDGRLVHLSVTMARIVEAGRERFVTVARDVTDEVAKQSFAHRAERLASVGTLLSGVAHELNNPLNAIRNFAQLMLLDERNDDDRESLEIIQQESDRAAKIVSDLRRIARQTRETGAEREDVDLNEVVAHVLKLRRYTLETHNIEMAQELAPDLPTVWGSRGELEQVILNLLINSEQALARHDGPRRVELRTWASRRGVHLRIADSGPGIAPEHAERIFDPFWTTKPPGEGTGLGLSLVHSIVTDHGGVVELGGGGGDGARFTILFPSARKRESAAPTGEVQGAPITSLRVLVVDDEAPLRVSIARYLRRRGHIVEEAADGAAALAAVDAAGARGFDVVLTDLRMPGADGRQLVEALRERVVDLGDRIVVMTGDAASGDSGRIGQELGAPALIKPVRLEEVAREVERHSRRGA